MILRIGILLLFCCIGPLQATAADLSGFAVAKKPVPVFTTAQSASPKAKNSRQTTVVRCGNLNSSPCPVRHSVVAAPVISLVYWRCIPTNIRHRRCSRLHVTADLLTLQPTAPGGYHSCWNPTESCGSSAQRRGTALCLGRKSAERHTAWRSNTICRAGLFRSAV